MRMLARAIAASALLVGLPVVALAQSGAPAATRSPVAGELTGAQRAAALTEASASLNRIAAMQGRFTQVAPDGSLARGRIYMQRPGKLRFEYDPPSPLTIVSDGSVVAVEDRSMRDVQRIPLRSTPLFYVLKPQVNLERDARITRVVQQGDALHVSARDRSGEADGEITITFLGDGRDLKQWSITDGQRQTTRITLSDVQGATRLDPKLFRITAYDVMARPKNR
ncbi:MAG: outer-membrane lipoprotein carrier protein LolA [Hyphomonadaceae bacterium]|nr:outer-membrane lipoprotein carrier protein LolA [Hyphomonadaceae bacterium]